MYLPDLCIQKWVLTNLKLIIITCLAILFAFSIKAQALPGQLPVNLKTFKARAEDNNKVKVFWTTAYEKNNAYFDIERSSDGVNFTLVGRVAGVNNNGVLTDYIFYDYHSMKGISFYRLKQVDVDLKFSYSPIERVRNFDTDVSIDVFPNPVPGTEFKIDLLKKIPGNIDVLVFDESGRLQIKQQFSNDNVLTINHHLPAGMYTIKITAKEFNSTRKLVIR
ncbi:MAG: T9SS type A sorting domain-containing protein [Ferruginibacter sp.]